MKNAKAMKTELYYHFTGDTLRDGQPLPKVGEWLEYKGELVPCKSGLHASEHPFDALKYGPGQWLHLVEMGEHIATHGDPVDKVVSNRRRIVKSIDATNVMRRFSRRVALDVLPSWKNAPQVVKDYLATGDESLRAAAWAAARAAAWAAARAAARAAAWDEAWAAARAAARAAAWNAARAAARAAAWDEAWAAARDAARAAAWNAARDEAWDAAMQKYRQWFQEMVDEEFAK